MDEVTDITDKLKSKNTRSKLRKAAGYAFAAIVGAAALAAVAVKVSNDRETPEQE